VNENALRELPVLATTLRNLPSEFKGKFNMATWGEIPKNKEQYEQKLECLTAACAIGLRSALFPNTELKMEILCTDGNKHVLNPSLVDCWGIHRHDFEAISVYYGITYDDAEYLFYPGRYREHVEDDKNILPNEVADRIEQFLKDKTQ
jgi:hypothetical protein